MPLPTFANPLEGAAHMFRLGFDLFPLAEGTKSPLKGWKWMERVCTIDSLGTFNNHNFAIRLSRERFVADPDEKHGKSGGASLAAQAAKGLTLPRTLTVGTPTGGKHIYLLGTGKNSVDKIMPGVDIKAYGGFVVCPGSKTKDGEYTIIADSDDERVPIAPAPEWLLAMINAAPECEPRTAPENVEIDNPNEVTRAIEYLKRMKVAKPAEPGVGNNRTYAVFCEMKDLGMSEDLSVDLVDRHYNPGKEDEEESWTREELEKLRDNAWGYGKNAPGSKTEEAAVARAQQDFSVVPLPESANPKLAKAKEIASLPLVSSSKTFENITPRRDWIIMNSILGGFLTLTGAPGATGKSNYEILRALTIVTGRQLVVERNNVVKTGPVVLYNCEDPLEEMERRIKAFCTYYAIPAAAVKELYLVSGRDHSLCVANVNQKGEVIVNDDAVQALIATVKSVGAVLLSVDPLVRAHGLNENDNMAMDKVTQAFQRVSSITGCGLSILHHTNKAALNTKKGEDSASQAVFRGAGSLAASARIGEILTTMSESEASTFGIPVEKRRVYFKVENAKANLGPPSEFADWYESIGQEIDNGEVVGVCRVVKLTKTPKVKRAPVNAMAREEALTYLRSKVPIIGTDFEQIKEGLRMLCEIKTRRTDAVIGAVKEILGDQNEFRFTQSGPRKPYRIERAGTNIPLQNLN